jgi:hypothetical protein
MSQFSSHNPYQMGKEAYADGLSPLDSPPSLMDDEQREFRRGWVAAKKDADYQHNMDYFFRLQYRGAK